MFFLCAHYDTQPGLAVASREEEEGSLVLARPGVCEATRILAVTQDGDLALSRYHWKTTASGYHTCQQDARGVALAMMLLAAAAAEVGKTRHAFIFFAWLFVRPGSATRTNTARCVRTLGPGLHPEDCSLKARWPLGVELTHKSG